MNNSYWIWYWGDYEIFHTMAVHLRREEREMHIPPFWKISTPYPTVKFKKSFSSRAGYLLCRMNGKGYVMVDGKRYPSDTKIYLSEGQHTVELFVTRLGGLPAAFVESDVCPSNESWSCAVPGGKYSPVGLDFSFDRADVSPESFPFEYRKATPVEKNTVENGILYDFGDELFGYLNISGANESDRLNVFYGESKEESLDTEYTYLTESVSGSSAYRLRQRAFRYVYICGSSSEIDVFAEHEYLPLEYKGSFKCENALFDRIVSVAAHTFHLNCREAFFDGIKRDRWVWSGDAYQSARINKYLFADERIEQRTLLGLLGKEPIDQHINTIVDYSLLWIISLHEHYMAYGNKDFLGRIYPMANGLLQFCETRINKDGFIEGIEDDWCFIDWSDMDKTGAICAEQMLLIKAYSSMAYLADELGGDGGALAEKCASLKRRVNEYYWSDERGAFIDSYTSGKKNVTRHANIFAVMYGIASEDQAKSILKNVLKNDSVTKITTPYFEGYELDALSILGEFEAVESKMASYWGGMIELGAATFWEEYDPSLSGIEHYAMYGNKYEKSLCHAWGAGPIYIFGRYYLGVYPTSAGYETFNVEPNRGTLKSFCGKVPVKDGYVSVRFDENGLFVTSTVSGGTLIWGGKAYPLEANRSLCVKI